MPLSKLRDQMMNDENKAIPNFSCNDCADCQTCKISPKVRALTRQEEEEQKAIKRSVEIDYKRKRIEVDLPFTRDPVPDLKEAFRGRDNLKAAEKVYKQQCKKPKETKDAMKEVHKDLVERGFMKKLSDMSEDEKKHIKEAEINHYHPWRAVHKDDLLTTRVRLVVDASMTKLNMILAKGENKISRSNEILVRNRLKK